MGQKFFDIHESSRFNMSFKCSGEFNIIYIMRTNLVEAQCYLRHDAGMFTVKGINRLKILQDAIDRNLHPGQAAEMLGITPRHCRRLLKRYRQLGPLGMNNHSRGRVGNHLLPTSLIDQALCIIREHYRDFGPTLALENLEEVHGLVLGKETIRRLMIKAGIWIPRR